MKTSAKIDGRARFTFEVERYLVNGEYLLESPDENDNNYIEVTLEVSGWYYSYPAKIHGDPLDCYPAECDYDITSIIGPDNQDWYDKLSKSEIKKIIETLIEKVSSNDDYDF